MSLAHPVTSSDLAAGDEMAVPLRGGRVPATVDTAVVGATVFTSRTGRVARTVTALEDQPAYPEAGPIVYAKRSGRMECGFALHELWVEVR